MVLINNINTFDGKNELVSRKYILIKDNKIEKISTQPIDSELTKTARVIDGKGLFLMPGLIDAHWHAYMCCNTMQDLLLADNTYTHHIAGKEAGDTLQRGFTTIRDAGGPVFGLKRAIDTGILQGPRIYPSGAMISQTSGHGDFRPINDKSHVGCGCESAITQEFGVSWIVDGVDAVTTATRENLRQGASQIKLLTGGGAASLYDPLDVTEFFEEEVNAAVRAAEDWGTYVMVHVYNPRGIARAIKAGVKSIEHGHLIDEPTMEMLGDSGTWLSMQPFTVEDNSYPSPIQEAKHLQICKGTDVAYSLAKKYKVKLAWGTDLLFNPKNTKNQNYGIIKLKKWFSNYEILKMVTSDNASLLSLSGSRNPYPGQIGVIEEGALADLLIVNGNAMEDIDLLNDPDNNLSLVMKDGVIYKDKL